jgi:hypothetical protein
MLCAVAGLLVCWSALHLPRLPNVTENSIEFLVSMKMHQIRYCLLDQRFGPLQRRCSLHRPASGGQSWIRGHLELWTRPQSYASTRKVNSTGISMFELRHQLILLPCLASASTSTASMDLSQPQVQLEAFCLPAISPHWFAFSVSYIATRQRLDGLLRSFREQCYPALSWDATSTIRTRQQCQ